MQNSILVKRGMFFLALLAGIEHTSAQAKKNADGYSTFSLEELTSKKQLRELSPEIGGSAITSYVITIGCEKKDLHDIACTGDTLSSAFHAYLSKTDAKRCLCYFDKIMADDKPLKGFVIEVKK